MKLYLSSYRIPDVDALLSLIAKPASAVKIALIPNAKDYYADRARDYKVRDIVRYQSERGLTHSDVVDLRNYRAPEQLFNTLQGYDLIWAIGGNTFCLRQEMHRSGFEVVIHELLAKGIVYGGDSAGAVAVGTSLRGIESVDIPEFTEEVIYDGLQLIPYTIVPHSDNEYFTEANEATRALYKPEEVIELRDDQAAVFEGNSFNIITTD